MSSINIKNTTIQNGFINNPHRVYITDYFEELPSEYIDFTLTSDGNTDFKIHQPANTFLKELYVVCISAPNINDNAGNVGLSLTIGTSYADIGHGTIVKGTDTNIINSHKTMAEKSIAKVFPAAFDVSKSISDNELTPIADFIETSLGYTDKQRELLARVKTSKVLVSLDTDPGAEGKFRLIPVYGSLQMNNFIFNKYFQLSGTGTPVVDFSGSESYTGVTLSTSKILNDNSFLFSGTNNDNMISKGLFTTSSDMEFETSVIFQDPIPIDSNVPTISFIAGMKLTKVMEISGDANQAYFAFGAQKPLVGSSKNLKSQTTWQFVYTNNTNNYVTDLGVKVFNNTSYNLRFVINKFKKISVFVNNQQYGLTQEQQDGSEYGVLVSSNTQQSSAMATNISLYPVIGLQTTADINENDECRININYVKLSRSTNKPL